MRKKWYFDPRAKLCTILFANCALLFPLTFVFEWLFVTLLACLFLVLGEWRKAFLYSVLFYLCLAFEKYWMPENPTLFTGIVSFFFVGGRRLLPTLMAASFSMSQTKISEWIAALRKLRFPFPLIVALTVLFRFFPTILQDFKDIQKALRFRGIASSKKALLFHPIQTVEYVIVPVLLSADQTAKDLSATAMVRGLGVKDTYTSVYPLHFKWIDYLLVGSIIFCMGGNFLWPLFR